MRVTLKNMKYVSTNFNQLFKQRRIIKRKLLFGIYWKRMAIIWNGFIYYNTKSYNCVPLVNNLNSSFFTKRIQRFGSSIAAWFQPKCISIYNICSRFFGTAAIEVWRNVVLKGNVIFFEYFIEALELISK